MAPFSEPPALRLGGARKNDQHNPPKADTKNVAGPKPRIPKAEPRQRAANPKPREAKNEQKRAANPKPKKPSADQKQHVASLKPRKPDAEPKQRAANLKPRKPDAEPKQSDANLKPREPKTEPKRGADPKARKPKAGSKPRAANPKPKKPEAVPSPIINRRRRMPKPDERTLLRGMVNAPPPTRVVPKNSAKTSKPEWYKPTKLKLIKVLRTTIANHMLKRTRR
ncbi:hypothetical protein BSKO_04176 [Bryopsis sp. KO-2023]|nr:hypothetical protein BSKO_04176 [Bryopsis sp. KO-2023]